MVELRRPPSGTAVPMAGGLKNIEAASAGVILYLQIVFATLWGLTVLSEQPDAWTLAGSLLVLCGTMVAARRPRLSA